MSEKFQCPCCGYKTLREEPPGTYDICPVCRWEDDPIQFADPSYRGGANSESLTEARENFRSFGASSLRDKPNTRPPTEDEID